MSISEQRFAASLVEKARSKTGIAIAGVFLFAVVFTLTNPIPQDPVYHQFADAQRIFSVPNFWNVASNLPFLLVGIWGLIIVCGRRQQPTVLRPVYAAFFFGVLLTAFGSGFYHFAPANQPLVWDRLPMTIAIAGLFAAVIGEYESHSLGRRLLVPFLAIGALSVFYWHWTELRGVGDLRPYAIVQFLPMLVIFVLLIMRGPASSLTRSLWWMVGFYFFAKIFEHFDAQIYALFPLSGHTLKHLFAALGPAALAVGLRQRNLKPVANAGSHHK
ncbi:MAG: ceramidase domain-containing protein [Gammaproteobacteria bacterium]|nr:ceramidase domain-containing protein [Gammaproteobacteria bacterium]